MKMRQPRDPTGKELSCMTNWWQGLSSVLRRESVEQLLHYSRTWDGTTLMIDSTITQITGTRKDVTFTIRYVTILLVSLNISVTLSQCHRFRNVRQILWVSLCVPIKRDWWLTDAVCGHSIIIAWILIKAMTDSSSLRWNSTRQMRFVLPVP